ncbi:Uncharacterised protein [Mycobacteroides abscessus subsp. abscessus]|uniref:hypothetical protein n=1 Tax=Mycobacteroides abscessus TaxID=36809 RepID=UPI00092C2E18|nr:hypothetical protein [Mycobacteroides abscessus]SIJ02764.1 Uncharacterised protein [Mycobacteroides abscessus subsp. abscessus]SIN14969.1 Uncharacterised protein [Mycobacteroides abscessus subsp. abscessus]
MASDTKSQKLLTKVRVDVHGPNGDIDVVLVDVETPNKPEGLADWFDEHVYPHTDVGEGLAADGNGVGATATIVASSRTALVGQSTEWG